MRLLSVLTFLSTLLVTTTHGALEFKGADISSLLHLEASGSTYKSTNGVVTPFEVLLKNSGANSVRQRLWVNPANGNYNLAYNVRLAKRARAAGLKVYLDMHFSDTWADPAHQDTPAAWRNYNIDNLAWALYNYTLAVSNTFQDNGVPLDIISIGNEIRPGLLWPLGRTPNFYNIARLLHSASAGIKDSRLNPKPRIMLHLDNGWDWGAQQYFYDNLLSQGPFLTSDYDLMGVSYYPFYGTGATLSALKSTLANMYNKYRKGLLVVETDWPATADGCAANTFPSDLRSIPHTPAGQVTFMRQVAAIVAAQLGGLGLYYWEPGWVGNAGLGSSCWDNLMVDGGYTARSSLAVFGQI